MFRHPAKRDVFNGVVLLAGVVALVFAIFAVGDDAKRDARVAAKVAARELTLTAITRTVRQRRSDLVRGCEKANRRVEADILHTAAAAMAATIVSEDRALSNQTRHARLAESNIHWDAVASLVATLVDCDKSYPKGGGGRDVLDVKALQRIRDGLRRQFGAEAFDSIDQSVWDEVAARIQREIKAAKVEVPGS